MSVVLTTTIPPVLPLLPPTPAALNSTTRRSGNSSGGQAPPSCLRCWPGPHIEDAHKEITDGLAAYAASGLAHTYLMDLSKAEVIDATVKGGTARFINHSCEPNCETQKWQVRLVRDSSSGRSVVMCASCRHARFINHSCQLNCETQQWQVSWGSSLPATGILWVMCVV